LNVNANSIWITIQILSFILAEINIIIKYRLCIGKCRVAIY